MREGSDDRRRARQRRKNDRRTEKAPVGDAPSRQIITPDVGDILAPHVDLTLIFIQLAELVDFFQDVMEIKPWGWETPCLVFLLVFGSISDFTAAVAMFTAAENGALDFSAWIPREAEGLAMLIMVLAFHGFKLPIMWEAIGDVLDAMNHDVFFHCLEFVLGYQYRVDLSGLDFCSEEIILNAVHRLEAGVISIFPSRVLARVQGFRWH
jgi:hypothetical protein